MEIRKGKLEYKKGCLSFGRQVSIKIIEGVRFGYGGEKRGVRKKAFWP